MVEDNFYPAVTLPAPLSVVWGRFPYDEKPGQPGADFHPCLVFEWNEFRPDQYAVLVAFGTGNIDRGERGINFIVSKYEAQIRAGLNKETLFDLGRTKWLQWSDRWFSSPNPAKWPTPVIGKIGEGGERVLRYILQQRAAAGLPTPRRPE